MSAAARTFAGMLRRRALKARDVLAMELSDADGRQKDLIIRGGHNLYPGPIEAVVAEVEGVRSGCVAAVGLRDERMETERAVVVAETRLPEAERPALAARVREALRRAAIPIDEVVLVGPGAIPRTTRGKVRRGEVAAACGLGR